MIDSTERGTRKSQQGVVISTKMEKTVVVEVTQPIRHPRYEKIVQRRKKFYAHSEDATLQTGDTVLIMETRPLSKLKRWRVVKKIDSGVGE